MALKGNNPGVLLQGYLVKAPPSVKSPEALQLSVYQWRKRWFVLFVGGPGAVLEYWADQSTKTLKGTIKLTRHDRLRLNVKSSKFNYTFSIVTPHREYFLAAADAISFMHWVTALGPLLPGEGTKVPKSLPTEQPAQPAQPVAASPAEEQGSTAGSASATEEDEESAGSDDEYTGFDTADGTPAVGDQAVVADTKALKKVATRERLETFLAVATQSLAEFSGRGEQYIDEHNGFALDIPVEFVLYNSGKTTMWIGPMLNGSTTSIYVNTTVFEGVEPAELQDEYEKERSDDQTFSVVERCTVDCGFDVVPALRVQEKPKESPKDYQRQYLFAFGNSRVYTIATVASVESMEHPHLQRVYAQVLNSVELMPLVATDEAGDS